MGKVSNRRRFKESDDLRVPVPPEQTSLNVRRQAPTYPGADGEEDLAEDVSRNEEPGNVPDEAETGPVFDRAEGPPPTFYSGEGDPEAKPDDANEVEVRHGRPTGK